jgi:potassium voltage-gated channel Eag-related subfamily H protein 1/potassium voltage-gated channel Eag-related subfamily H protein 5
MTFRRNTLSDSYRHLLEKKKSNTGNQTEEYKKVFKHVKFIYKRDKDMTVTSTDGVRTAHPESIFKPDSPIRLSWDIFMLIVLAYLSISIPFYIGFYFPITGALTVIEFIVQLCLMLDILIICNTSYSVKGMLVTSRRKIIWKYIKGWFWIDILSGFPYNWLYTSPFQDEILYNYDEDFFKFSQILKLIRIFRIIRAIKLIKIVKAKKIINAIEDSLVNHKVAMAFIFIKLTIFMMLIAHWLACIWHLSAVESEANVEETWKKVFLKTAQDEVGIGEVYITALYWAFTTMVSVGYGDIKPYSTVEMVIGICTMASSSTIFAYIIGTFNSLITSATAQESSHREIIIAVNRYMKKVNLPNELQFKVRSYLDFIFQNQNKSDMAEESIMQMLSLNLKDEIYTSLHGNIINSCMFFKKDKTLNKSILSQIHRILKFETFAPKDIVFKQGETSRILYFILSGKVDLFHQNTKYSYITLSSRMSFGEIGFFVGKPRTASARCLSFTEFFSISFEDFSALIANTQDADRIEKLKQECEGDDFSGLFIECYMCKTLGHIANNCKLIVFNYDREAKRSEKSTQRMKSKKIKVESEERKKIVGKRKPYRQGIKQFKGKNSLANKINNFNFNKEESLKVVESLRDNQPKRYSFIYNITESSHEEDDEPQQLNRLDSAENSD